MTTETGFSVTTSYVLDPLIEFTAALTETWIKSQPVGALKIDDLPAVIRTIYGALRDAGMAAPVVPSAPADKPTAKQIRDSITDDALISFEDGKPYRSLKRHLTARGLTPAQYREKYGLPKDYGMVAPSYSARRSELAKANGLGRK
jgi:predicted transcriptional regulator